MELSRQTAIRPTLSRRGLAAAVLCSVAVTLLGAPPASDAGELPPVKLFFVAANGEHGRELWRSDGTRAGTRMVRDIRPGPKSSEPRSLVQLRRWLLFTADDGEHGRELWRTDGTAAGTRMVKNLRGARGYENMALGARVGRYVYYRGWGRYGRELWRTDGTTKGTRMVRDIRPGVEGSMENTRGMAAMNGVVYFGADKRGYGRTLWRSDGTRRGTYQVSGAVEWMYRLSGGASPEAVDDTLYFQGRTYEHGIELWASDGTRAGTRMVKNIRGYDKNSHPSYLTEAYGQLYFVAIDTYHPEDWDGWDLFRTDGTADGTVRLHAAGSEPVPMLKSVYFNYYDGLYRTSGSRDTVTRVRPFPSQPDELANVDLTLYFAARGGKATLRELWRSDGTEDGTRLVKNINPDGASSPRDITDAAGTPFFFTANDGKHGRELWRSDGTRRGTYLVRNINPGSEGSAPYYLRRFDRP